MTTYSKQGLTTVKGKKKKRLKHMERDEVRFEEVKNPQNSNVRKTLIITKLIIRG